MGMFSGFTGLGDTPLPKGLRISPSPESYRLLATPVGRALFNATKEALEKNYNLQPVGLETEAELLERISMVFTERHAAVWQGTITAETVNLDPRLEKTVADLSVMSSRKSYSEILATEEQTRKRRNQILLLGGGLLVFVFAAYFVWRR